MNTYSAALLKLMFVSWCMTAFAGCTYSQKPAKEQNKPSTSTTMETPFEIQKSETEWKAQLTPEQYAVIREKGTERPFTGKFEAHWEPGVYTCAACGNELFLSDTKFDAGCGWPSFYEALDKTKIIERIDKTHGMIRTEIVCAKCGGHLGHVFNDGPNPTGLRYCVNSLSLDFNKKAGEKDSIK